MLRHILFLSLLFLCFQTDLFSNTLTTSKEKVKVIWINYFTPLNSDYVKDASKVFKDKGTNFLARDLKTMCWVVYQRKKIDVSTEFEEQSVSKSQQKAEGSQSSPQSENPDQQKVIRIETFFTQFPEKFEVHSKIIQNVTQNSKFPVEMSTGDYEIRYHVTNGEMSFEPEDILPLALKIADKLYDVYEISSRQELSYYPVIKNLNIQPDSLKTTFQNLKEQIVNGFTDRMEQKKTVNRPVYLLYQSTSADSAKLVLEIEIRQQSRTKYNIMVTPKIQGGVQPHKCTVAAADFYLSGSRMGNIKSTADNISIELSTQVFDCLQNLIE